MVSLYCSTYESSVYMSNYILIGEVAEKLIDVDADVMRRKESRFSTSYDCTSKRGKSSESHKPQHNSMCLVPAYP